MISLFGNLDKRVGLMFKIKIYSVKIKRLPNRRPIKISLDKMTLVVSQNGYFQIVGATTCINKS